MKKKRKGYTCTICNPSVSYTKLLDYMDHVNTHTGERPYMCPECGTLFHQRCDYAEHVLMYPNFHWYSCDKCSLTFYTSEEVGNHNCLVQDESCDSTQASEKASVPEEKNEESVKHESNYKCFMCPEKFNNLVNLKTHRRSHFELKSYQCRICFKVLRTFKLLVNHVKFHSQKFNGKYNCLHCNHTFNSFKNYRNHIKEFKNEHNFICKKCGKWFSTVKRLLKHECLISDNGEPFQCSCLQTFTSLLLFKKHAGQRPYSCCKCEMKFDTLTNLTRHIRTHTKQKPFICKECGRRFTQSANLKNHESVHLEENAAQCNKCSFNCKTQNGLLKHIKSKHNDVRSKPVINARKESTGISTCLICDKEFLFKRNLGMHMKIHDRKEYLCPECGKMFDTKGRLTAHYKTCHSEPSVCKTCGKFFPTVVSLTAHEKIHVSEKEYACGICFKMFTLKTYLIQHMKTHNTDKQYSCTKCGKLFKVAVSLKYHGKICK